MLDNLGNLERTHSCGALRNTDIGKQVTLMGWVAKRRDFGDLTFVDLRDRVKVVSDPALGKQDADVEITPASGRSLATARVLG